jgi:hypothetical protein
MIFAFEKDDQSLMAFHSESEAVSYCEGIDVKNGVWQFFRGDGAPLKAAFSILPKAGLIVTSGKYALTGGNGPNLRDFLGQVSYVQGCGLQSTAEVVLMLEAGREVRQISPLSPALDRFDQEAAIIGRLLTGYSAIEYQLCLCAGMGGGDVAKAIVALFIKRGETRRVRCAEELGQSFYDAAGLGDEYAAAINDTLHCVGIRNQYAHCIWHDDKSGRLAFAHMEEIAAPSGPGADPGNLTFHYVDVLILEHQAAFFFFVKDTLNYLNHRKRQLAGEVSSAAAIRIPTAIERPRLHL